MWIKQTECFLVVTWTEFNMPPCLREGRPFGSVEVVVLVVLGWVGRLVPGPGLATTH
jgi:hypothetical protein